MNDLDLKAIVLFEDEHLVALNKPAGLLSIEDGYDIKKLNLRTFLRDFYGAIWAVHRLDKDTSGVIIFAKNEDSYRKLNTGFSNRLIKKNYRGIINGIPIWKTYKICLPLLINGDKKHRTVFDPVRGKSAFTLFNALNSCGNYSYLDIFPETGYTHQIRAHLSSIGFPILGDYLYWRCCKISKDTDISSEIELERYFLHSFSIKFNHPFSNLEMVITAPLPPSFSKMLSKLGL